MAGTLTWERKHKDALVRTHKPAYRIFTTASLVLLLFLSRAGDRAVTPVYADGEDSAAQDAAKATYERARDCVTRAKAALDSAQTRYDRAGAAYDRAKRNHEESTRSYGAVRAEYSSLKDQCDTAKSKMERAKRRYESADRRTQDAAKREYDAAKAEFERVEAQYNDKATEFNNAKRDFENTQGVMDDSSRESARCKDELDTATTEYNDAQTECSHAKVAWEKLNKDVIDLLPKKTRWRYDFNGDKKDDIISFSRGEFYHGKDQGDVFVAISLAPELPYFSSTGWGKPWHEQFCWGNQIPAVGDFDGNDKVDIVCFLRSAVTQGDIVAGFSEANVWVSLSTGEKFASATKWHSGFCIGREIPAVGDFNGDGADDIVCFARNTSKGDGQGNVYVSLSDKNEFLPTSVWHDYFCINDEIPLVGDFNGDGKDDIITFMRDTYTGDAAGDVYVALSTGGAFMAGPSQWHNNFCRSDAIPVVGDYNGDGRDDIACFDDRTDAGGETTLGNVYVALSTGHSFEGPFEWSSFFGGTNEIPAVGDFNGDGCDDVAMFTHDARGETAYSPRGDVKVALSTKSKFGKASKWHEYFCFDDAVPTTLAALFPYYMFPYGEEDGDKQIVCYASNEDDWFMTDVVAFDKEFDLWPCTGPYNGLAVHLQGSHLNNVDSADLAYVGGHGNISYISFADTDKFPAQACWLPYCSWGSWSSQSRRGDLDYIVFQSCSVLSFATDEVGTWRKRWKASPHKKGPFSGLHMACGFLNTHLRSSLYSLADEFAENLEAGYDIRTAWLDATEAEAQWVSGYHSLGVVMYIRPHKNETIHDGLPDLWYHDPKYELDEEHWVEE
ncbi:MAG: FG-GAP-like repeat-containing protein [Planctomycetota bacterium]|nr:FG-GAP-like repeat-containing protein [Planctomycetota bacterium]